MNCLETFKSAEDITLIHYYATGKLEMQGSAKLLHLYHYGNCLCLIALIPGIGITGECNIYALRAATAVKRVAQKQRRLSFFIVFSIFIRHRSLLSINYIHIYILYIYIYIHQKYISGFANTWLQKSLIHTLFFFRSYFLFI